MGGSDAELRCDASSNNDVCAAAGDGDGCVGDGTAGSIVAKSAVAGASHTFPLMSTKRILERSALEEMWDRPYPYSSVFEVYEL